MSIYHIISFHFNFLIFGIDSLYFFKHRFFRHFTIHMFLFCFALHFLRATTTSSITFCCYNLIIDYLCTNLQPHPLVLLLLLFNLKLYSLCCYHPSPSCVTFVAATSSSIPYVATTSSAIHYIATTSSSIPYDATTSSNIHNIATTSSIIHYTATTSSSIHYIATPSSSIPYVATTSSYILN